MNSWKVMNSDRAWDSKELTIELQEVFSVVLQMAKQCRGDSRALLLVLRTLEDLHRGIREELFLESLPDNRQELYNLLKDIEENGGWPYIERMKLRAFLNQELFVSTDGDLVTEVSETSEPES
ncbi:MAG: hypothetical protein SAL07_10910 [Oscillatoria sp. PMC 1051.18]|nr:hypothetical protein [Oscillatoria sp. PMC 1050.18]MEC5030414.1 hypothetical protein [Oscillatoria sp. PMC 1051.18]